jgi:hypothetical protein
MLIGFLQPIGSGSGLRTVQDKLSERVSVADKLPTGVTPAAATKAQASAALTAALASGAKRVYISQAYSVTLANASFTIPAGVILDFDGGSLTFDAATTTTNGLLYGNGANIKIIDPVIDCTAVTVAPTAINFLDAPGSKIRDPILTKCNIALQSSNAATRMGYQVIGGSVNGAAGQTCIYVSAAKGALVMGVEMFGAKEGLGPVQRLQRRAAGRLRVLRPHARRRRDHQRQQDGVGRQLAPRQRAERLHDAAPDCRHQLPGRSDGGQHRVCQRSGRVRHPRAR